MTLALGCRLPDGVLRESTGFDENSGCPIKPDTISVAEAANGKKIIIFGVPGAYTPTCSAQHLPEFLALHDAIKASGVDEIWCFSVNDAFVMAAWGRERHASGKIRMMADGGAVYSRQLGLDQDLTEKGMGIRCVRFALIADDGVISYLTIESPGEFKGSRAEAVLAALQEHRA
ncbi:MAG: peroxiredoxin [Methylococcaceae bacterium]